MEDLIGDAAAVAAVVVTLALHHLSGTFNVRKFGLKSIFISFRPGIFVDSLPYTYILYIPFAYFSAMAFSFRLCTLPHSPYPSLAFTFAFAYFVSAFFFMCRLLLVLLLLLVPHYFASKWPLLHTKRLECICHVQMNRANELWDKERERGLEGSQGKGKGYSEE